MEFINRKEKTYKHCGVTVLQKTVTRENKTYQCGIGKDSKGYYATTHRMRSESYPSKKDIPISILKKIAATG
jgi:hypothetical protein